MATVSAHDLVSERICRAPRCPNLGEGKDGLCGDCRAAARSKPARASGPLPVDELGPTIDPGELGEGEALAMLRRLVKARDGVAWAIGDLLAAKFPYGTKAKFAIEELGLTEAQAQHWPYVAKHVRREHRRRELSHTHHRLVAPLKPADQIELLESAVAGGWTVSRLERELRSERVLVELATVQDGQSSERETPRLPAASGDVARPLSPARPGGKSFHTAQPGHARRSAPLVLPAELAARVLTAAAERGVSPPDLIAAAIDAYLVQ